MPNVALVVLDTLRKDSFDEFFDWHPGVRYERAWSSSGWTVPAHASLFTGRYPSEVGILAKHESLACERPVLAERLSDAGYTTRAFSANAFVSKAYSWDRGFDSFEHNWRGSRNDDDVVDWSEFIAQSGAGPTRYLRALRRCFQRDMDTVRSLEHGLRIKANDLGIDRFFDQTTDAEQALDLVRSSDFGDDEFLFLNLMTAHSPYAPPKEYRTVTLDENPSLGATMSESGPDTDPETVRQAYDDAVRYLSDIYEDIFEALESEFDYIVTLGDHGELFGEYGIWAHSHGIAPELVHVPLAIYCGESDRERVDETVTLLDVYRTILEIAGIDDTEPRGQNLLQDPESRPFLTERFGLREMEIEKRRETFGDERIQQYDRPQFGIVLPGYYGWQTLDGFEEQGETDVADPEERLEVLRSDLEIATLDEDGDEVDESVKQRLERLGYA